MSSGSAVDDLPVRLRDDAIIEALCELRFEAADLPEIVTGRLADYESWADFKKERLPISEMPASIRTRQPELRFRPTLQLNSAEKGRSVRVGDSVLSMHVVPKYCGWATWKEELRAVIEYLFGRIPGVAVRRIGLRYINALDAQRHLVRGFEDLLLGIDLAGRKVTSDVNVNLREELEAGFISTTRIATKSMVEGRIPQSTSAIVDVDVFTPEGFTVNNANEAFGWVDRAHTIEKQLFFRLIPAAIIKKIRES